MTDKEKLEEYKKSIIMSIANLIFDDEKIIALKKLLDSETDPDVAVMKFRKFYMKPLQSENNYEK